ncbi:iron-containing alcohol dehydrogenase PsrA [Mitsuaria sp. BK037]|uniref:iron-containing alcohol dehydrogenase PsrA n=1 Tax=Mitsuaria sp. BK037 TaxID=2587122 RepID=UPI001614341B|nr:iron-containing alcohol dehydrogenase PsrA [Mitsuaria sp. BK037]MBB3284650.1 phosphonate metabolism-associated iron-containing alcohol dehydrogenase [Mitsuaria sp. BK037]
MTPWTFHNPVDVRAGNGALAQLPRLVGARDALLIAFPEAEALGLVGRVRELLGDRLVAVETDIRPNPDLRWLAPLYERLWREHRGARCVIALGGGSSIDCAKAMLTATPSGRFDELLDHLVDPKAAPLSADAPHRALIAVPTTAGTGSEVTPWATLWDAARGRKHSLHLPWTWPEAAIVDPSLMVSLPVGATLASGLDALSHALEALWNVHRNPVSSSLAASAARAIVATLPALLREPGRLDLREALAVAALQAGMAFSNTRTALAHSLSYDITLTRGTAHGIACSFSLPRVMRLAFGRDAALDARLLSIFDAVDADGAVAALERFLAALGVSTDPADYGISPDDWDARVAQALRGPRGRNFIQALA